MIASAALPSSRIQIWSVKATDWFLRVSVPASIWLTGRLKWIFEDRKRTLAAMSLLVLIGMLASATMHVRAQSMPQSCQPGASGFVDQVSDSLNGLMSSWPAALQSAMSPVFWMIWSAGVMFALVVGLMGTGGDIKQILVVLFSTIFAPTLCAAFFVQGPSIGPAIFNNIMASGEQLPTSQYMTGEFSSLQSIEPGSAYMKFQCVSDRIDQGINSTGANFDLLDKPIPTLVDGIASAVSEFLISCDGVLVMVELFMLKMEALFVLGIGVILLVGLAHSSLMSFPLRYLGAIVGLGMKGLALSAISGIAIEKATLAASAFGTTLAPPHDLYTVAGTLLALGVMGWFIPGMLGQLGGAPAMSFGAGLAAGMALVGAVQNGVGAFGKLFGGGGGNGGGGGGHDVDAHAEAVAQRLYELLGPHLPPRNDGGGSESSDTTETDIPIELVPE